MSTSSLHHTAATTDRRVITVAGPRDLSREAVEAVAWGGARLTLGPAALERVAAGQAELAALLAGGARVYGVNTGMGWLASVDPEAQAGHQRALLLGRAVGGPPWLEPAEARALLVARLGNLLSGHAGVGPQLCRFLVDRVNDGFVPAVPRRGAGSAGEVVPLAHAFQTLVGVGLVLGPDGQVEDAATALAERGALPHRLQAKEGIALLAGSPLAAALALARLRAAERLAGQLLASAGAAIDALAAPLDPYDEAVGRLAGDPLLESTLADLRRATSGRRAGSGGSRPQAPVSFRVAPQALAQLRRTLGRLDEDARRALTAVTDSPAVVGGRVVATGGFHAVGLAAGMDALAVGLVQAAELAGQRLHRLLDSRFSGLPDQLSPDPGPVTGLVAVHKRAAAAAHEARRLAAPASVGQADTALGQEDAASFAPEAAEQLRRVEQLTREVVACELLAARQAWWLRGTRAAGLGALAERLEELVAPVERDRPLGPDLDRLVEALEGARHAAPAVSTPAGARASEGPWGCGLGVRTGSVDWGCGQAGAPNPRLGYAPPPGASATGPRFRRARRPGDRAEVTGAEVSARAALLLLPCALLPRPTLMPPRPRRCTRGRGRRWSRPWTPSATPRGCTGGGGGRGCCSTAPGSGWPRQSGPPPTRWCSPPAGPRPPTWP
jgi:histidine ammonia-lyase